MGYFLKYKTNDENDSGNIEDVDETARLRLRVKYNSSGDIEMYLMNLDTGESYGSFIASSVSGTDITPVKVVLGADHDDANHIRSLNIEKITVK